MTSREKPRTQVERLALAVVLAALVAASGCQSDPPQAPPGEYGGVQSSMGMGWGLPGAGDDSDLEDPRVFLLDEYRGDGMRNPTRIATNGRGDIVVSDPGLGVVHVLSPTGRPRMKLPVQKPLGVAVDEDGAIYVGDQATGAVRIYDAAGTFVGTLGGGVGELSKPTDMAIDNQLGTIHVVDSGADLVKVYSLAGEPLFSYGAPGSAAGQMKFPTGIYIDVAGNRVFVSDHNNSRVHIFDRDGNRLDDFGEYGSEKTEFSRPQGLALDGVGRLYVVDTFQGRLQLVDDEGLHVDYLGSFGELRGQLSTPMDAVIDSNNRLLVTSYATGKVVVYGIDDYSIPVEAPEPALAVVAIDPPAINSASKGRWVSVLVELPERSVDEIVLESLRLSDIAPDLEGPVAFGDADGDGVRDLSVKLSLADLIVLLGEPGTYAVTLTGELSSGEAIAGEATVTLQGREGE